MLKLNLGILVYLILIVAKTNAATTAVTSSAGFNTLRKLTAVESFMQAEAMSCSPIYYSGTEKNYSSIKEPTDLPNVPDFPRPSYEDGKPHNDNDGGGNVMIHCWDRPTGGCSGDSDFYYPRVVCDMLGLVDGQIITIRDLRDLIDLDWIDVIHSDTFCLIKHELRHHDDHQNGITRACETEQNAHNDQIACMEDEKQKCKDAATTEEGKRSCDLQFENPIRTYTGLENMNACICNANSEPGELTRSQCTSCARASCNGNEYCLAMACQYCNQDTSGSCFPGQTNPPDYN